MIDGGFGNQQAGRHLGEATGVLQVVEPDEEVAVGQRHRCGDAEVDHDADEDGVSDGDATLIGRLQESLGVRLQGQRRGMLAAGSWRPGHQTGGEGGCRRRCRDDALEIVQGVRGRSSVVVHQPGPGVALGDGQLDAPCEPARAAQVLPRLEQRGLRELTADQFGGAVRGAVVDHDHFVLGRDLCAHRREAVAQQLFAVVGHDDDGNAHNCS